MAGIGPTELIIVLVLALLILGPRKLPTVGRSLGQGMREFRDGVTGRVQDEPALPVATAEAGTPEQARAQHTAA